MFTCFFFKKKGSCLGVEVIVIKVTYERRTIISPLDLAHYEYGGKKRVKDSAAVARMISNTLEHYKIVPDEFGDPEDAATLYQLVTISSDYPCLHKKKETGGPAIVHELENLTYLGPLWGGWRRGMLKIHSKIGYWMHSVKSGLAVLTFPKWTTTIENISKKYDFKFRKYINLSITHFWGHLYPPLNRIYQNLSVRYYTFIIMGEAAQMSRDSNLWRRE